MISLFYFRFRLYSLILSVLHVVLVFLPFQLFVSGQSLFNFLCVTVWCLSWFHFCVELLSLHFPCALISLAASPPLACSAIFLSASSRVTLYHFMAYLFFLSSIGQVTLLVISFGFSCFLCFLHFFVFFYSGSEHVQVTNVYYCSLLRVVTSLYFRFSSVTIFMPNIVMDIIPSNEQLGLHSCKLVPMAHRPFSGGLRDTNVGEDSYTILALFCSRGHFPTVPIVVNTGSLCACLVGLLLLCQPNYGAMCLQVSLHNVFDPVFWILWWSNICSFSLFHGLRFC